MADVTIHDKILAGNCTSIWSMLKNDVTIKDLQAGPENATPLFIAAKIGNMQIVDMIIEAGCDVNLGQALTWKTPFAVACEHGHSFVVLSLIDAGCHVNKRDTTGSTPLHLASKSGSFNVVKILLKQLNVDVNVIDKEGNTPLHLAVANNKHRVVGYLIANDAEVACRSKNGTSPLWIACKLGLVDITKLLIHEIVLHGSRYTLDDVDFDQQRSPLYMAVDHQHLEIVKLLVTAGVEVNFPAKVNRSDIPDKLKGDTPLLRAISLGNMDMIDIILQAKGCDIDQTFPGQNVSALHWAVILDGRTTEDWSLTGAEEQYSPVIFLRLIQKLLEKGANVNTYSDTYYSPLHTAAEHGNIPVAKMLLECGASINRPSRFKLKRDNNTIMMAHPVDLALLKGHEDMVRFLVEQGAQHSLRDWNMVASLKEVLLQKPVLQDWLQLCKE